MNDYNFEPEDKAIHHHVTSGILNSGVVQIVKIACQFLSLIILSRLLKPSDFGLMAMVSPIYTFIAIFHDLGLSQSTIQKSNLRHEEVNAFFWLNVAMGTVLTVITALLSPLAGWYYQDDRIIPLTIAMGLLILVGAIGNQHGSLLQRRMQFASLAMIDIIGTISGMIISILSALLLQSYWSLYCGMATAIIIPVTGVWIISRWRPTMPCLVAGLREMLKFGAGVTSFNFTSFIAGNMDNILIGRTWGEQELGFYDRAYKLLLFPLQRVILPIASTIIPLLSRLRNDPAQYSKIIQSSLEQILFALWPGIIWAVVFSKTLIPTVLGRNWEGAAPAFVPLGIAALAQALNSTPMWIFVSEGRGGDYARCGIVNAVTSVIAFLIGLPYGIVGVATAYAVSEYARTPFVWWYATRKSIARLPDLCCAVIPHCLSGIFTAIVLLYFHTMAEGPAPLVLIAGLALSYITFALAMTLSGGGRRTLHHTIHYAGHIFARIIPAKRSQV